jgi:transcriptional antiterminator RfaH
VIGGMTPRMLGTGTQGKFAHLNPGGLLDLAHSLAVRVGPCGQFDYHLLIQVLVMDHGTRNLSEEPHNDQQGSASRMNWYLVHTKPRQEFRALVNLQDQGFEPWLPTLRVQKVRARQMAVVEEPLFARYLFLPLGPQSNSAPIRSTPGVSRIVSFGGQPAKVPREVIDTLQAEVTRRTQDPARPLFQSGQSVKIGTGPFAGLTAVFDMQDAEARALVLIELMGRPARLAVPLSELRPLSDEECALQA